MQADRAHEHTHDPKLQPGVAGRSQNPSPSTHTQAAHPSQGCVCFGSGFGLRPATPGWGVGLCVCSCARSACTQPLLARVRGVGVCVWARVSAAPRHSRLGCALWVCVLGLGFWLRPATPGWGVGLCVCSCARSACTPPLLAWVRGVGVCVWARVSTAPRNSWLRCWAVCVLVCALRLHLATPGTGAQCGCVCFGSGFGCSPPLLAGVLGCVCAGVGAPLAPRHSWLGCALWVCVFGLGFRPRSASRGWVSGCVCAGVGAPLAPRHSWLGCAPWVCVFWLGFRLLPATPGWGVWLCVCWCGRSACTPPLLAGVRAVGVCNWARVSAAPRHSWLGCWAVCVLVWALRLHPATPGWGAHRGCVCLGSGFGCAPPILAGVSGCVCAGVGAPLSPRHSWLGCAPWVCVFGLGSQLLSPPLAGLLGCVCAGVGALLAPRHSRRTPLPGVAGCKRSAHTSRHKPRHPSQEWRGAAGTRTQPHTPTPLNPARSGRVQAERTHKRTHTPTPQPGVAGRSRNPNPTTTQTQTPARRNSRKPSVHSPGTEAARAMQVTRPNEIRRPGVRLHPKACAALGLEAERATPKHLGTPGR